MAEQHADEQSGPAMVDVQCPQRVLGEREYVADQLQQRGLVVQDSLLQETFSVCVGRQILGTATKPHLVEHDVGKAGPFRWWGYGVRSLRRHLMQYCTAGKLA
ncbi:hypothetical protein ABZ543_24455 [Streptomyces roseifaciens]